MKTVDILLEVGGWVWVTLSSQWRCQLQPVCSHYSDVCLADFWHCLCANTELETKDSAVTAANVPAEFWRGADEQSFCPFGSDTDILCVGLPDSNRGGKICVCQMIEMRC